MGLRNTPQLPCLISDSVLGALFLTSSCSPAREQIWSPVLQMERRSTWLEQLVKPGPDAGFPGPQSPVLCRIPPPPPPHHHDHHHQHHLHVPCIPPAKPCGAPGPRFCS